MKPPSLVNDQCLSVVIRVLFSDSLEYMTYVQRPYHVNYHKNINEIHILIRIYNNFHAGLPETWKLLQALRKSKKIEEHSGRLHAFCPCHCPSFVNYAFWVLNFPSLLSLYVSLISTIPHWLNCWGNLLLQDALYNQGNRN